MTAVVRVGLVGADAAGRGWGPAAHVPALRALSDVELAAVCTSRPESAAAAAETYGVPAFHDVRDLVAQPGIDLVAVVVRVPRHREVVMPALEAGKAVFCEWPLGANSAEAHAMAALAAEAGVVTGVGLQGRNDPVLGHIRTLHDDGWLGEVVAVDLSMLGGGAGRGTSSTAWMGDARNGANDFTIIVGHSLDTLTHCLGPIYELAASVTTHFPHRRLTDTGETIDVDAPDSTLAIGRLADGARLTVNFSSVPHHGTAWRMAIYGTEATLVATSAGLPQISPVALQGARGDGPLQALPVPVGESAGAGETPAGPAANVARTYRGMAAALRADPHFRPSFDDAVALHELLDAFQRSSVQARVVRVG